MRSSRPGTTDRARRVDCCRGSSREADHRRDGRCDRLWPLRGNPRRARGIGYVWDVHAEHDEPARKVFRKGPADTAQLRSHHLHLTIKDSHYWRRLLDFRDELRRDPAAAVEYAAVKASLLISCEGSSRAYTRGETGIVRKIERAAGVDSGRSAMWPTS